MGTFNDPCQSKPLILLASAIPSPACGGASAVPSLPLSGPRGWRRAALAPIMNVGKSIGQIENTQGYTGYSMVWDLPNMSIGKSL